MYVQKYLVICPSQPEMSLCLNIMIMQYAVLRERKELGHNTTQEQYNQNHRKKKRRLSNNNCLRVICYFFFVSTNNLNARSKFPNAKKSRISHYFLFHFLQITQLQCWSIIGDFRWKPLTLLIVPWPLHTNNP